MKNSEEVRHIITTIDFGGAENQLLLLTEMQIKSGMNVEVVYLKGLGQLQNSFEKIGVSVINTLNNQHPMKQILMLRDLNRNFNGILHLHLPQAELTHRLTFLKKVTVTTRHYGGKFSPQSSTFTSILLSNFAASGSNLIIAISNHVFEYLLYSKEILRKKKIITVHYGFDKESYLKNKDKNKVNDNNTASNRIKIGCVARLSKEKNHVTLFRAIQHLIRNDHNVKLYLAGEGNYRDYLEQEIENLGITENVIFLGKINYVPNFIAEMDLLVLPSIFEGFGMIIMEALASGKVILCADNSAMREILSSDLPDTLFSTFDFLDLANKILNYSELFNQKIYEKVSNQILLRYSPEIMNQKILNIYNSISISKERK